MLTEDPQEILAFLQQGICPCCGQGPFELIGGHVKRKHGISMNQLKDMIGMNRATGFCSEEQRARRSENGKKFGYSVRRPPPKAKGLKPDEIAREKLRKNRWSNSTVNAKFTALMKQPEIVKRRVETLRQNDKWRESNRRQLAEVHARRRLRVNPSE